MPYHFVRRAGVLALAATMVVPQAGALSDVSSWAQEDIAAAQQAGLMPTSLADSAAREEITRAEFCAIAVKAYKQLTGKAVYASGQKFFRDTDDANVNAAYSLGLVNGRANGYFDPNASIERQDLCVILNNILDKAGIDAPEIAGDACVEDYDDVSTIKSYAVDPVVRMVDYTIVNGISDGLGSAQLAPSGTATREQAVIMANRFCSEFEKLSPNKSEVVITTPTTSVSTPNNLWNTPSTIIPDDKMTFVYGPGGSKYTSAEEAEAHMVEIAVPVWRLQSDGTKTTGTAYLQVNASLAAIYKAIFEEIYNGDEKFPINDVGCYSWRTGEHSQGTAVDINPNENMEATINADGSLTPTCGTHWTPYTDPFSIPEGGDVYNAFTKYGFAWGGNAWHSKRDYMHFSYFGK